ncbi:hypothetical protein ISG33_14385 [Glaciecola sp. MH2013]|uniref:hypothetical protein n=1 Tax=Glaciecola sp. MH2013 TaxID=2785524 RepID=UPI0018A101C5|nr:hypothetical protein [Glaciecola sp. MH2013]MBF7074590.1 hypothetical protein [Glaciecola sp. MH2013]
MSTPPILENDFYHDGRGPELHRVRWKENGVVLVGFEYFNPDDEYTPENLKHLALERVEAYSMSSVEVHGNILATSDCKAAIFEVKSSGWLASFNQSHLSECKHYQIMFYDEIYDVICGNIKVGAGKLNA